MHHIGTPAALLLLLIIALPGSGHPLAAAETKKHKPNPARLFFMYVLPLLEFCNYSPDSATATPYLPMA